MELVLDVQIIHLLYEVVQYLSLLLNYRPLLLVHLVKCHHNRLEDAHIVSVLVCSHQFSDVMDELTYVRSGPH